MPGGQWYRLPYQRAAWAEERGRSGIYRTFMRHTFRRPNVAGVRIAPPTRQLDRAPELPAPSDAGLSKTGAYRATDFCCDCGPCDILPVRCRPLEAYHFLAQVYLILVFQIGHPSPLEDHMSLVDPDHE
jgi:hypothetical protein